jgi:hypothetical protein
MKLLWFKLSLLGLAVFLVCQGQAEVKKSQAVPADSPRLSPAASEFTLSDPRVALYKIDQARDKKDASKALALIQAYWENATRRDGYSLSIQIKILQTLAEIKSRLAVDFLVQELANNRDARYRDEIAFALGEIGDSRALPALKAYLIYLNSREPSEPLFHYQWQTYVERVKTAIQKLESVP